MARPARKNPWITGSVSPPQFGPGKQVVFTAKDVQEARDAAVTTTLITGLSTERQLRLERQRTYSRVWNEAADPAVMLDLLAQSYQPDVYTRWRPPQDQGPRSRWPEAVLRKLRLWMYEMSERSAYDYRGSGNGYDVWGDGEPDQRGTETNVDKASRHWCDPERDNPGDPPMPVRAALLRELLGDPYTKCPYVIDSADRSCENVSLYGDGGNAMMLQPVPWATDEARAMARTIWHDRDWQGLGPLADRLEESGCTDARLLGHLRDRAAPHCRGCWALDLLLGHTTSGAF